MNLFDINKHIDEAIKIIPKQIIPSLESSTTKVSSDGQLDSVVSEVIAEWLKGDEKGAFRTAQGVSRYLPKSFARFAAVVDLRWQANLKAIEGDYDASLNLGTEALRKARSLSAPGWFTRDILLDLRNIELREAFSKGAWQESVWQKQLLRLKRHAIVPMLDREVSTALEVTLKESYEADTELPNTVRLGSNLNQVLESFGRAFAYATSLGSYTYFFLLREMLAQTLYHYSRCFKDPNLVLNALKLTIMQGKVKALKRLVAAEWESLYAEISKKPMELVEFPVKYDNSLKNQVMKSVVIELSGVYIRDTQLCEVENFLFGAIHGPFAMVETEDLKRAAVRATGAIIRRCRINLILPELIKACNNAYVQDELLKVLSRVRWSDVENSVVSKVATFMMTPPFEIFNHDLRYAVMLAIGEAQPEAIRSIENGFFKELLGRVSPSGTYLSLYFGDHSESEINAAIARVVEKGRQENEGYTKGSPIGIGGQSWVYTLGVYLEWMKEIEWEPILKVFHEVLVNRYQAKSNKYKILDVVCQLGDKSDNAMENLVKPLAAQTQKNREIVLEGRGDQLFLRDAAALLELALYRMDLMIGDISQEEVIAKAVEYGSGEMPSIKEESLRVIGILVQKQDSGKIALCPYLYAKCFDSWPEVRAIAIENLAIASRGVQYWENTVIKMLHVLIAEKSPLVRVKVVEIASKQLRGYTAKNRKQARQVLDKLSHDSHYEVRELALKTIKAL